MSHVPFSKVRISEFPKDLPILNHLIEDLAQLAIVVDQLSKTAVTDASAVSSLPVMTVKKGSGTGTAYTTTSTTYVDVDATNLSYAVFIPRGWKLHIVNTGGVFVQTALVTVTLALTDKGVAITERQLLPTAVSSVASFVLNWIVTGDDAMHEIRLRFATTNVADAVGIQNASGTLTPVMQFILMPSS